MSRHIPFHKTYVPESFLQNLPNLLNGKRLEGSGENNLACEDILSSFLNGARTLLTSSCTSALEAAVKLADIGSGDEVILPSYTFVASASAITRAGATPVFVDIDPETLCIDLSLIEQHITARTKAILAVHYAGFSCDMDSLKSLANRHNLRIIEDAAQSLMIGYKDTPLGTIGDFGCFSFHDSKVFSAGEGGALCINAPDKIDQAIIWRDKGTNRQDFLNKLVTKYEWVAQGTNACMSELNALFLKSQLDEAGQIIIARGKLFATYQDALTPLEDHGIKLCVC